MKDTNTPWTNATDGGDIFKESWSLFDLLDDFGSGVMGDGFGLDVKVEPEMALTNNVSSVGTSIREVDYDSINDIKENPNDNTTAQVGSGITRKNSRTKRKIDKVSSADETDIKTLKNKEKRQLMAKISRQKRKEELVELKKRIKLLEKEQQNFIAKISDLKTEAHILQHAGEEDLKAENDLLRQEIMEHRSFVNRLQVLMNRTRTSALELQSHSEKTERLQLRRRCFECAEYAMKQILGLAKISAQVMHKPDSGWNSALLEGKEDFLWMHELLPKGSNFSNAIRMNSRMDLTFPVSVEQASILIRSMSSDQGIKKVMHDNNIITSENIYVDPEYESGPLSEKSMLRAHYNKERIGDKCVSTIGVTMAKAVTLLESNLVVDGSHDKELKCIVHSLADASHIFPKDPSIVTPASERKIISSSVHPNKNQKFFIAASIIRPDTENSCILTLIRSEQIDDSVRESFALSNEDMVFRGQFAKRLIGIVERLNEKILEQAHG